MSSDFHDKGMQVSPAVPSIFISMAHLNSPAAQAAPARKLTNHKIVIVHKTQGKSTVTEFRV